jgi:hypothetical protein
MEIIEGRNDIVKDPYTGAVINIDTEAHQAAVAASKARQIAKEQINNNTNDINSIKEELSDIKSLLKQLADNNGR